MYRTNAQSRAIEEAFLRYGIRYQLIGGTRFYQRREVKDALAYLRILRSDTDSVAFERILNVPARGIGEKTLEALRGAVVAGVGRDGAADGAGDEAVLPGTVTDAAEPAPTERGTYWAAIEAAAAGRVVGIATRTRGSIADFAAFVRSMRERIGVLPLPELLDARPRAVGLPGDARRRLGGRRGPLEQPARAALGDHPLRRPRAGGRPRPAARGDGPRRRPGLVRRRGRRGHPHHPSRSQGSRVPGRLHLGTRGGGLPAQSGARRRTRARGGAPAGLRRDHPGEAPALPVPRLAPGDLGLGRGIGPVALPARDPPGADGRPDAGRRRRRARRWAARPRPRLRREAGEPVRVADPGRRRGVPAGQRPTRRADPGRRRLGHRLPTHPRPRLEARRLRRRGALGVARAGRRGSPPGTTPATASRPTTCRSAGSRSDRVPSASPPPLRRPVA